MGELVVTDWTVDASSGADPFLLDAEGMRALASDAVVRRGLVYHAEHRVTSLGWDDARVWAEVAGSAGGVSYEVDVVAGERDGELECLCTCPFEDEPVCKHAIAALAEYAKRHTGPDAKVLSAAEEAVADRQRRGRSEVVVEHVAGDPEFGAWRARSLTPSGASLRPYEVLIRSLGERMNTCSCPDFAVNLLGTCKHIEAVLHTLTKKRRRKKLAAGPHLPVVYLRWDPAEGPQIRLRRVPGLAPELAQALDRHFDPAGALHGSLPEAFFHLQNDLAARSDLHIGNDASAYAHRLAADAAHAARARRIKDDILFSGGQLPGVHARLYPYQIEGVAFLASTGRALLADDMGLGKTLQAIAAARYLFAREGVARVLVVCPASLKHQWAREITRFTGLDAAVIQGGAAVRRAQYAGHATFTIVNYELVLRDRALIQSDLAPDLLILDEAQRIKNWRGRTATAVKSIASRYAFVLTGTPLENRLEDLYSVMQVVDPRVLGPLWQFMAHFHVTDERGKVLGYRNLSELRRRLAPVMLRRDKRVVRDQLPDRIEQRLDIALTPKQRVLHDGAISAASTLGQIARRRPLTPVEEHQLLAALQCARMACNAAGLVDHETVGSPKLDELGRVLDELCRDGGQKVVVFSQWERMTAMAEEVVKGLGLGFARLHGGVPTASRGALIARFHDDPDCRVFLSTDAGATGLNLQCATVLINLELPFNPALLNQRIGRIHRLGQRQTVQILHFIAAESYEERVAGLIGAKRALFDTVIEPESTDDVVGLTPRALQLALEALPTAPSAAPADAEPEPDGPSELPPEVAVSPAPAVDAPGPVPVPAEREPDLSASLGPLIEVLQHLLGHHLERILATRTGYVCLVDGAPEALIAEAEAHIVNAPVAVVDRRTWAALARLEAGVFAAAEDHWVRPAPALPAEPPLRALARKKLAAAEALTAAHPDEALALLTTAIAATLAQRAGRAAVPDHGQLAVWLYGDLVPHGLATPDEAAALLRAHGLAQAADVPVELVTAALDDARRVVLAG